MWQSAFGSILSIYELAFIIKPIPHSLSLILVQFIVKQFVQFLL